MPEMPGAPLHPLRSGRRHAAAQWKSKQKSKKYVWKLNDHAPKIKWFQDAKLSVCGRIFWTLCEIPTNLVKYLFLNVTLLLFLAPFHNFSFLFSSPHFLGDRLPIDCQSSLSKNRDENCKILAILRETLWTISLKNKKFGKFRQFRNSHWSLR